ncbi:MAG TPA: lytic murein transglycosylase [Deltaproteobacteria bacterium]|nr:lytic murein transglycosylase [Deltaproteobacteria bacterium]
MKRQSISIVIILILILPATVFSKENTSKRFIEEKLVEKGLDRDHVKKMLYDQRVSIDPGIIMKNLFHSSPKGSATQPEYMEIDPKYIDKGGAFIRENAETFSTIEKNFGTSAEVITAILIVESRLGTYPENYNVFVAYTNLAVILDPTYLEDITKTYGDQYPKLHDKATLERARKKANWALNELHQLIVLSDELNRDPLDIIGSFAGALGPGQFIPSSFIEYGQDGDQDGKKDPFNMADSMASIAHYLKRAGWREDASIEKKRKAVWHYNHSDVYVNTIMMLYTKLRT